MNARGAFLVGLYVGVIATLYFVKQSQRLENLEREVFKLKVEDEPEDGGDA